MKPLTLADLQSITGANIPVDAAHVSALQRELNRYTAPGSPFQSMGAPLLVSGVLDDATALRTMGVLLIYATQVNVDLIPAVTMLAADAPSVRQAWVSSNITTAYTTAKGFADSKGLPPADPSVPMPIVIGALVVGALLLFGGGNKKKGKR